MEYKIETIIVSLLAGFGVLWHQLIKQVGINRTDQKEFSKLMSRNIEVMVESNGLMRDNKELMSDIKDFLRHGQA